MHNMAHSVCPCGYESTDRRPRLGTDISSEVPQHTSRCKLGRFAQSLPFRPRSAKAPGGDRVEEAAAALWSSARSVNELREASAQDMPMLWSHRNMASVASCLAESSLSSELEEGEVAPSNDEFALVRFPCLPSALSEYTTQSASDSDCDTDTDSDDEVVMQQPWEVGVTLLQCRDGKNELRWVVVDEIRPDRHWSHR